uniref:Uncharacterized protein n=1 Tax=Picea sitchensis TaxID=3332 RepID=D5AB50_PICSI|nr:unknown [Picea sitchensis]
MQRSSSHVGTTSKGYPYTSSIQLDKSTMSLRDSECDTASMYSGNYRRSLEVCISLKCFTKKLQYLFEMDSIELMQLHNSKVHLK